MKVRETFVDTALQFVMLPADATVLSVSSGWRGGHQHLSIVYKSEHDVHAMPFGGVRKHPFSIIGVGDIVPDEGTTVDCIRIDGSGAFFYLHQPS